MRSWRRKRAKLPRYRRNPLPRPEFRWGPLGRDEMSGLPEREGRMVEQDGILRSVRYGTVDLDDREGNENLAAGPSVAGFAAMEPYRGSDGLFGSGNGGSNASSGGGSYTGPSSGNPEEG